MTYLMHPISPTFRSLQIAPKTYLYNTGTVPLPPSDRSRLRVRPLCSTIMCVINVCGYVCGPATAVSLHSSYIDL